MASLDKISASNNEFTSVREDIFINVLRHFDEWTDMVLLRTDELLRSYGFARQSAAEQDKRRAA